MARLTAKSVAKYLISKVQRDQGDEITNLKLQKLLYYCQAWHLAITGRPLFSDRIQAWIHGPVVPSIWKDYPQGGGPITDPGDPNLDADEVTVGIIDEVWGVYGPHAATTLRAQTHKEAPWRDARAGLPDGKRSTATISHESMRDFYRQRLKK